MSLQGGSTPADTDGVFCWFEQRGAYLRCEARTLADGCYEFRVTDPEGTEHIEVFSDGRALAKRQGDFQREVVNAGWAGPHGWNL